MEIPTKLYKLVATADLVWNQANSTFKSESIHENEDELRLDRLIIIFKVSNLIRRANSF